MQTIRKKSFIWLTLIALMAVSFSGSALAKGNKEHKDNEHRYTNKSINISVASALTMIVKGLNLNIDHIRFIKEPKASDYFTKIKDDASYANSFIIAQFNGIELAKDIKPSAKVTREQFTKWLYQAMSTKGDYSWTEQYILVADDSKIAKENRESIQRMLIAGIVTLDKNKKFYPVKYVTQKEASTMIKRTVDFIAKHKQPETPVNPEENILYDLKMTVEKVSDEITKVALSAQVPHPGYGLDIAGIRFVNNTAFVDYRVIQPDPAMLYPQVIANVKAETYIPARYIAVLGNQVPSEPRTK